MVSRGFAMRLAQAMLVLVLGLSVHTAQGRPCFDCETCGYSCPEQVCGHCPAEWYGSCFAGTEGCAHYGCEPEQEACCGGAVCRNQCYCPPCN